MARYASLRPSPHPSCCIAMALWYGTFPDDEVRFAKAVATPYLLRCTTRWLCAVSDGEVRFAKAVATPYLLRCTALRLCEVL